MTHAWWHAMQVTNRIFWFPVSQSAGIADRPGYGMTTPSLTVCSTNNSRLFSQIAGSL